MASADAQQSASPPAPPARFDPQTGQPIAPDNNMGAPAKRFDPQTGEPIA